MKCYPVNIIGIAAEDRQKPQTEHDKTPNDVPRETDLRCSVLRLSSKFGLGKERSNEAEQSWSTWLSVDDLAVNVFIGSEMSSPISNESSFLNLDISSSQPTKRAYASAAIEQSIRAGDKLPV